MTTATRPHTLEELIWHMGNIVRGTKNKWERGFAASILRASKKSTWTPSAKQEALMRRLVADRSLEWEGEDDVILIED